MRFWLFLSFGIYIGATVPSSADYAIASGDQLRLSYLGVPGSTFVSVVDADGKARFPLIGSIQADGLTLDEFEERVRQASSDRSYPYRTERGELITIDLAGYDAFVEIAEYRPVTVVGYVSSPGIIPYQPGLTVLTAMTRAGGASVVAGIPDPLARSAVVDLVEREVLGHQIAALRARLWRQEARAAGDPSLPPPPVSDLPIAPDAAAAVIEQERIALKAMIDLDADRLATLRMKREGADEALELVQRQLEITREIMAGAEDALARLENLSARGLTQTANVEAGRRALAQSNSQLVELLRLERDFESTVDAIRMEIESIDNKLLQETADAALQIRTQLNETEARLKGVDRTLLLFGSGMLDAAADPQADLEITVLRDGVTIEASNLNMAVLPGDVITVRRPNGR